MEQYVQYCCSHGVSGDVLLLWRDGVGNSAGMLTGYQGTIQDRGVEMRYEYLFNLDGHFLLDRSLCSYLLEMGP